ncbi:MAG: hypothetical protein WB462_10240 [Solirubrobacterales bacterium]
MPLRHFLLIYNTKTQKLLDAKDLGTSEDDAAQTYSEYEERYRDHNDVEIVLVGADSLETIKTTHSHYFDAADGELFPELAGR